MSSYDVSKIVGFVAATIVASVLIVCVTVATMRGAEAFSADLAACVGSGGEWDRTPHTGTYACTRPE